jgi:hypothetical protein
MAYLDSASVFSGTGGAQPLTAENEGPSFSALEWTVVALARRDHPSSLAAPSALARALGGLFGLGRKSKLADPRLEALRRIAVHAWHRGYQLPISELKSFLAAGFSSAQAELLLASVTGRRSADGQRQAA